MKKALIIVLFALFPFTSFAAFDHNLKYGSGGSSVLELQEFLTANDYYAGPITGYFFSLTLAGVKKFQAANNLPTTGYFGPMSRAVATALIATETASSTQQEITETGTTTEATTTPTIIIQTVQNPIMQPAFGGTITPMPEETPVSKAEIIVKPVFNGVGKDPSNNIPFGSWAWNVWVLDSLGNYIKGASVTVQTPNDDLYATENQKARTTTNQSNNNSQDWNADFSYAPSTAGTKTITFTSGGLTKSLTIVVE